MMSTYAKSLSALLVLSLILAILFGFGGPYSGQWPNAVLSVFSYIWPKLRQLPGLAADPSVVTATVAVQWCFFPIYFALLLLVHKPWSVTTRNGIENNGRKSTPGQKVWVLIFYLFLVIWTTGTIRLSSFPTFINGGVLTANRELLPAMLKSFYYSRGSLTAWSWIFPFAEANINVLTVMFTLHMKSFLFHNTKK